jgi:hypothetical protein
VPEEFFTRGPSREDAPAGIDTSVAHIARVYDYWLGGKDNFAADREAAEQALAARPGLRGDARANRAFLARAVRYLTAEAGIRQFLDIGTGIPTANNTHQVAQAEAPTARVVYVDNDPMVLVHARALLTSSPEGACAYVDADARDTSTILDQAAQTLDMTQPIALVLLAIMHFIPDADDPYAMVGRLVDALPAGSYLVLSHPASDIAAESVAEAAGRLNRLMAQRGTMRNQAEVAKFFEGLELLEPGVARVAQWRPESEMAGASPAALWCGVAIKR